LLVLIERFLETDDELIAFAPKRGGIELTGDMPHREDADLESFGRVLIAFVAFGAGHQRTDDLGVVDEQLEQ
jgi:hypothetical protein